MDRDELIDDLIELWHGGDTNMPLYEYLGMTRDEYGHWVETSELPKTWVPRDYS